MRNSILSSLLFVLAVAPLSSSAGEAPPADTCTIVFGQGRNLSESDPAVNVMWNRVNDAFNQFVTQELRAAGRRVVAMPHPVEARDMQANFERVVKRANAEGCDSVADLSMFADQASSQFVSSMRVHRVLATQQQSIMRRRPLAPRIRWGARCSRWTAAIR